jgi:hypothetical protein
MVRDRRRPPVGYGGKPSTTTELALRRQEMALRLNAERDAKIAAEEAERQEALRAQREAQEKREATEAQQQREQRGYGAW